MLEAHQRSASSSRHSTRLNNQINSSIKETHQETPDKSTSAHHGYTLSKEDALALNKKGGVFVSDSEKLKEVLISAGQYETIKKTAQ